MEQSDNGSQRSAPQYPSMRVEKKKSRWWMPLVVLAGIFVFLVGGMLILFTFVGQSLFEEQKVTVKQNTVLHVRFKNGLPEYVSSSGLSFNSAPKASFLDVLLAIRRAKTDDNVKGLFIESGGMPVAGAQGVELLDALIDFKKSGKFVYSFIEAGTRSDYYLSLAADSIFMPSEGMLDLSAPSATGMFLKDMLGKLGVETYVEQFEEYKSAGEMMSRSSWSEPAKEEVRELMVQRSGEFNRRIAERRKLSPDFVVASIDAGIYEADSLRAKGFIDAIAMQSDVRDMMKKKLFGPNAGEDDKLHLLPITRYVSGENSGTDEVAEGKAIAIIYGVGPIQSGKRDASPFGGETVIGSESMAADIRKARDDEDVNAILLRVDSPGGSVIASDQIRSEIEKARKKKPVYISMGNVAASGGYYIAMACDTIIAHPSTITGSIGVIAMIPNLTGTMQKLGVGIDTIELGSSANYMNPVLPFNDQDKIRFRSQMEGIYKRFVSKVAAARGMSYDDARKVAKGRVWTGLDATSAGLVDVQGGLQDAINITKKRIGVLPTQKVKVKTYPEKTDDIEALLEAFGLQPEKEEEAQSSFAQIALKGISQILAKERFLPPAVSAALSQALTLVNIGAKERVLLSMPYLPVVD